MIHGITIASAADLAASQAAAASDTLPEVAAKKLADMAILVEITKLTSGNWTMWLDDVRAAIEITGTSAVFVVDAELPTTTILTIWRQWWSKQLGAANIKVQRRSGWTVGDWFAAIVAENVTQQDGRGVEAALEFWAYVPMPGTSIKVFLREFEKRLTNLATYADIDHFDDQLRFILVGRVSAIAPDLGHKIRQLDYPDALQTCREWCATQSDAPSSRKKQVKCHHCGKLGHKESACRTKQRVDTATGANKQFKAPMPYRPARVHAIGKVDGGATLDSAADNHVVGNADDLDYYTAVPTDVIVAGGGRLVSPGRGHLRLPASDGTTEVLPGAIVLEGQTSTLLSLKQLEDAGYSLRWSNTGPVADLRPDGTQCAMLVREDGRLIWRQARRVMSVTQRDWHRILGHPGPKPLALALQKAGIKDYKAPDTCVTCDKSKMTRRPGHGSLRTTSVFGRHLHFDLVGGRNSLLPPNTAGPSWYLLAVDEATGFKWGFPVESKKEVPALIETLLQRLAVQHDSVTVKIHCDAGTEFTNSSVRSILDKRGIQLEIGAGLITC